MNDGLSERNRQTILAILTKNPRVERVVLFGSRATGGFSPASDIDLALFGDALTLTDQARLASKIERTTVPQEVDLVRFSVLNNPVLKHHIKAEGVEWFSRQDEDEEAASEPVAGARG